MVRTLKKPEIRRNEIIDAAQRLFLEKGYDRTSVQEVLDEAGIAKGTFYYYFGSKLELLDSLINRISDNILAMVEPIVGDERLSAPQKMEAFFDAITQWKTENRRFLMDLVRVIYRDENAVYRQKMTAASLKRLSPMLAVIIEQGIAEGVFAVDYPAETSWILIAIIRSQSELMVELLLDEAYEGDMAAAFERLIRAQETAIARVLGYEGSLQLIDLETAKLWIEVANREINTEAS